MASVLAVGVAVVDFVFYMDRLPTEAEKFTAPEAEIVGGGCAATAAVAIARLGGDVRLSARIGADQIGRLILDDLGAEGVDTALMVPAPGGRSSFSSIYVDGRGERQIMNFRGGQLDDGAPDFAALPRPDAVLVDTRWQAGAVAALEAARAWGVPGVVDAEAPIDGEVLSRASHVAFSAQGLRSLVSGPAPDALAEVAHGLGVWSCVTDGPKGVWYTGAEGVEHAGAREVAVVDTLGAGDVWHGAFALALAEGLGEAAAVRFATAAATLKCTRKGGRAGAPKRAELDAFMGEAR